MEVEVAVGLIYSVVEAAEAVAQLPVVVEVAGVET